VLWKTRRRQRRADARSNGARDATVDAKRRREPERRTARPALARDACIETLVSFCAKHLTGAWHGRVRHATHGLSTALSTRAVEKPRSRRRNRRAASRDARAEASQHARSTLRCDSAVCRPEVAARCILRERITTDAARRPASLPARDLGARSRWNRKGAR